MPVRSLIVPAAIAALFAPVPAAVAADIGGPPGSPGAVAFCSPPPAALAAQVVSDDYRGWFSRGDHPRIITVEPYDVARPPLVAGRKHVIPQTAFLASSLCEFPDGVSPRSWYDGKLFYIQGGNRSAPDTFMIIERK
jgi:hypothetical protein